MFAGMAIYEILKRNKAYKIIRVDALAGSISSVIAFAGDRCIIPKNAYFMIHNAWKLTCGNSEDHIKAAKSLQVIDEGILNIYEQNLKEGVDIEKIKMFIKAETWFTGEQASQYFNIEVDEENEAVAACGSDFFERYSSIPESVLVSSKKYKNNTEDNIEDNKDQDLEKAKAKLKLLITI